MKKLITLLFASMLAFSALAAETVNINTASAAEIAEALQGVGMGTAEKIVAYREENGTFSHIDELVNVKGIGVKTLDKNRERIVLDGAGSATGN